MEVEILGHYIRLPCLDSVGSCIYYDMCTSWSKLCAKIQPTTDVPCFCPIPAGDYSVTNAVIAIESALAGLIAGNYRITANLASASLGPVGCVQIIVNF